MRLFVLWLFFLCLPCSVFAQSRAERQVFTVDHVIDGDTLRVTDGGPDIRLWGVNAPERGQWGYFAAGAKMESLIGDGGAVSCEGKGSDQYGRRGWIDCADDFSCCAQ